MIEPELAFADLADDMACAEAYLKHCVKYIMEVRGRLAGWGLLAHCFSTLADVWLCQSRWNSGSLNLWSPACFAMLLKKHRVTD